MKKLIILCFCTIFSLFITSTALADVAVGPMYAVMFGVPALIIAVVVIAVALLVRAIKRKNDK